MDTGGTSPRNTRPFAVSDAAWERLKQNPGVMALFVGLAGTLVGFREYVVPDWWQLVAAASQLAPQFFEQQFVFRPRTPFEIAVATAVGVAIYWGFALVCTTSVYRIQSVGGDRSSDIWTDLRHGVGTAHRTAAFLLVASAATIIGLLAFVVPGIVVAVRLSLGVPVLVLERQSILGAAVESWRLTAGREVDVGIVVAALVAVGAILWRLPDVGPYVAFVVVGAFGIAASVVLYDVTQAPADRSGPTAG